MKKAYKGYEVAVRSLEYGNKIIFLGRKPGARQEWMVWTQNTTDNSFGPDFKFDKWKDADDKFLKLENAEVKKQNQNSK